MFQDSTTRKRKPVDKFGGETGSGYVLLYFIDEHKYDVLPSSSTLFAQGFSYHDCCPKQTVVMKPDITAKVVAKSVFQKDMEIYRTRMEAKLRETSVLDVSNDSLNFLSKGQDVEADANDDNDNDTVSIHTLTGSVSDGASKSVSLTNSFTETTGESNANSEELELLKKIVANQNIMVKELKKLRKSFGNRNEVVRNLQPAPVFYKGMDMVSLGRNNLDPSRYAAKLGRALFTDQELQEGMLFPKRSTGRPSLSPTRSTLFKKAFQERFPDEEEIEVGVAAVNCLGNDLKKGKRKRSDCD